MTQIQGVSEQGFHAPVGVRIAGKACHQTAETRATHGPPRTAPLSTAQGNTTANPDSTGNAVHIVMINNQGFSMHSGTPIQYVGTLGQI